MLECHLYCTSGIGELQGGPILHHDSFMIDWSRG